MKIAFLTPEYPHEAVDNSAGGIGTSIYNLAEGLTALGQKVVVLVYNQTKDEVIQSKEVDIYKIKNVKRKGLSWWLTRKKIERLINQLHKEKKIDLVEAPDWTGITSFMKLNCPLVIKLHGSDTYFCHLEKRPVKWFNRFHEKKALKAADAHISVSHYTAKKTNEFFKTEIVFEVIPNSVNTDFFKPEYSEIENTIPSILYFGTLIRKKGVFEIPHIFNEVIKVIPDAKLIMIGKDAFDLKTKSESTYLLLKPLFSNKAVLQQEYLGKIPYHKVKKYIKDSKVVIFPSYIEALPVSWLEAMSMGKVLVASNIGWAKEIIEHNVEGFLVNPTEHKSYASLIIKLFKQNMNEKIIEQNARNKVIKKFSIQLIASRNLAIYKNLKMNN
jgi:glycosyltransferase involved in cell wall biosynthesis